jgi:hypothetical protein
VQEAGWQWHRAGITLPAEFSEELISFRLTFRTTQSLKSLGLSEGSRELGIRVNRFVLAWSAADKRAEFAAFASRFGEPDRPALGILSATEDPTENDEQMTALRNTLATPSGFDGIAPEPGVPSIGTSTEDRLTFRFSSSASAVFDAGFCPYEPAHQGRWCLGSGSLTLWPGEGRWRLIVFVRNGTELPDVYIRGQKVGCSVFSEPGRSRLEIILDNVLESVELQFLGKGTFVPAEIDTTSQDRRRLSFWLCDEFSLQKIVT